MSAYDVIVIGGGLAGSAAAAHLADRGHAVLVLEKDTFPRHKLCGEFLSPEVQSSLDQLGLLDAAWDAGAHPIRRTRLTAPDGAATTHALPDTALGLSRYQLDALLFRAAGRRGADGRTGARVRAVTGSLADGFAVTTADGTVHRGRVVLGAYGKRSVLDRTLERPFLQEKTPYVAFKAHYAGADDAADATLRHTIELHSFAGGYCGCSHVEDGRVNVCWIGHVDALKRHGGTPEAMLDAAMADNPALAARLQDLTQVSDRFEAISQVSLASKSAFDGDVCMIGDAAGMIAPLCGDGMAMALRSAELAAPHVDRFLRGRTSASAFRRRYRWAWRRDFGVRMTVGRTAHAAAFRMQWASALVRACRWCPPLAQGLIRATRG